MLEPSEELSWLDYFSGGVPTGEYFRMTLDDLRKLVTSAADELPRNLVEVCFIGLVSYFEAFCKDHFASIINILPTTAIRLRDKGHDTTVDVAVLLRTQADLTSQLGFLLAEKFDFGTPQKVNALYGALLTVTPFSKDEASVYDRILRDRHLLVHHGGTYTSSYLHQMRSAGSPGPDPRRSRAFFDSLVVTKEAFLRDVHFFKDVARKLLGSTRNALHRIVVEENLRIGNDIPGWLPEARRERHTTCARRRSRRNERGRTCSEIDPGVAGVCSVPKGQEISDGYAVCLNFPVKNQP